MGSKIKQKIAQSLMNCFGSRLSGHYDELFCNSKVWVSKQRLINWRFQIPPVADGVLKNEDFEKLKKELTECGIVKNVNCFNKTIDMEIDEKQFVKDVLDTNPLELHAKPSAQRVIVEFSSPNIAKPFHVGHLKSTMIGNCLANIKNKLGDNVTKLNYLGDWGTQFGLIKVGLELENHSRETFMKDPIRTLFKAYVKGNREAEKHQEVYDKAKAMFMELESGNLERMKEWNEIRKCSMDELNSTYQRLGVEFNEYNWESDYKRSQADGVLKMLDEKGILAVDEKGRMLAKLGDQEICLVKSDNTTLYLLRDLMAVLDRKLRHKFDEMYYVVENGQNAHFISLFNLCNELNFSENAKLEHVKIGRIHGMSTRKGTVTFLNDVLDEAKERAYEKQQQSKNTKVQGDAKDTADVLGVTAVVVNDLKQGRKKDYEFSWDKILQLNGETGIHLQYCHCRLHNLQKNCGITVATECDPEALTEPEAINLVLELVRLEEVLYKADADLEPCVLVTYLFRVAKCTNLAFKALGVKNSGDHVGSQRLLLFVKSREVLAQGLQLLGCRLLTTM